VAPRTPTRSRQARPVETEVDEPGPPLDATVQPQVAVPDEPRPAEEGEITKIDSLMNPREIEVDPVEEAPIVSDDGGMVIIRMNTTLEDFTYGNPHMHMRLEEGKRYRVPLYIGHYLDGLGYVWH
jgi:hypothetical protein